MYIVENFQTKTNTRMVLKVLVIVCVCVCVCVCVRVCVMLRPARPERYTLSFALSVLAFAASAAIPAHAS